MEEGYGINLLPLATLAMEFYAKDLCVEFKPKSKDKSSDDELLSKMHKAISIIQFKLEGEVIKRNPTFNMEDRLLLHRLDDSHLTLNRNNLYALNEREKEVVDGLIRSFKNSEKLQEHIKFLLEKGSIYLKRNSNLLFHGCIPLDERGGFREVDIFGKNMLERDYWKDVINFVERDIMMKIVFKVKISYGISGVEKIHHFLEKIE